MMYRMIIIVLDHFFSAFNALTDCVSCVLIELLQFYLVQTTWSHMVLELLGSDSKACILEATRAWHVLQHEFSDFRCDIVLLDTRITFSQVSAIKIKSKQFSGFGSRIIWFVSFVPLKQ